MKPLEPCRIKVGRAVTVSIDVLIFLSAVVALAFLELVCPNIKRGFICDDPSLSLRYNKDTVPMSIIILYGLTPIIFIWLTELIFVEENDVEDQSRLNYRLVWRRTLCWFKDYGIGLMMKLLVLTFIKVLVGAPRPHFLETCQPDMAVNCTTGQYVESYECTNPNYSAYFLRDSARSFPSGHSSISVYTSLFMVWYLQCRLPKIGSLFLIAFLQLLFICFSIVCSVTRITDNRHFWWDVVGGSILGAIFAIFTCKVLCQNFKKFYHIPTSNVNGSSSSNNHRSVRRLLTTISAKEEFSLNNLE